MRVATRPRRARSGCAHWVPRSLAFALFVNACTPNEAHGPTTDAQDADAWPARVELGRHAFYDPRLSADGQTACASCHAPEAAFADPRGVSVGADGVPLARQAPSLVNVAERRRLTWANPNLDRLDRHALVPLFSDLPVEMGNAERQEAVVSLLREDPTYRALATQAFGRADAVGLHELGLALAAFQTTIRSAPSALVDTAPAPALARHCTGCHTPPWYTDATTEPVPFHRISREPGADDDTGLHRLTHAATDRWRFRTPTLRNVGLTAPYLHDGSAPTLDAAIRAHTALPAVAALDAGEREQLIDWLHTLTDAAVLHDAALADPWPARAEASR